MSATSTAVKQKTKQALEKPKNWKVIILNDDKTPMNFVVSILMKIFRHSVTSAEELMMKIHLEGSAVGGVYPFEIAEAKSVETVDLARQNGFPLQVKLESE
jgi:ATP-dependent Clp protease adaptor protein ClpS